MISGMLPNNTIWWLSTNGQKIWIESKDIELNKFKEKGYNIKNDILFHSGKAVGELTTSRLESRKRKDAWILKLESVIDVYPELTKEIQKKDAEDKKKKKELAKKKKMVTQNTFVAKVEQKSEFSKIENRDDIKTGNDGFVGHVNNKEPQRDYFDINRPYVQWIKDEVEKNVDGVTISFQSLKEKMGSEFLDMHDLRIFFGLQKILPNIGITIEQRYKAKVHVVIIKKILQEQNMIKSKI